MVSRYFSIIQNVTGITSFETSTFTVIKNGIPSLTQESGIQQPLDHKIVKKKHQLVGRGVTQVNEMKRHLGEFLTTDLFPGCELPNSTNRRFFPTKRDVRNHISTATIKQRFAKCDQTNVQAKLREWQKQYPHDNFFFRPYADVTADQEWHETTCNDSSNEDDTEVNITTSTSRQKLLYVHQTSWQKRLLSQYGNDICLLDATYKTTRYSLPLFFLAVKTNVDYQMVGSFIVQDESKESRSLSKS